MKRTPKTQKLLENLAEIPFLMIVHEEWDEFCKHKHLEDTTDQRNFAIDAALVFHRTETRILKKADKDFVADFDWYVAMDGFVQRVIICHEELEYAANLAILEG